KESHMACFGQPSQLRQRQDRMGWHGSCLRNQKEGRSNRTALYACRLGSCTRVLRRLFKRMGLLHQQQLAQPDYDRQRAADPKGTGSARRLAMMLNKKVAVIYGAGGSVGGAVTRAFAREVPGSFSPAATGHRSKISSVKSSPQEDTRSRRKSMRSMNNRWTHICSQ